MTRITNSDQILAIIRNQLQRLSERSRAQGSGKATRKAPAVMTSPERLAALNAIDGLTDEEFARGLVRTLLEDAFGEKLGNSPGFLDLVDRTLAVMQADPQTAALLRQIRSEL